MREKEQMTRGCSRRDFIKLAGGGGLLSLFPWLQSCTSEAQKQIAGEKVRIAVIGTGSRGQYHLNNMRQIPQVEVVALCDT